MEKLEVTHIQPKAMVEMGVSTKGVRTWTIKCRGDVDSEVLDRIENMNKALVGLYGEPVAEVKK